MPQRTALRRPHQVGEDFTLGRHALVELHFGGVLHGLNAFGRRRVFAFGHAVDHVQAEFEKRVCVRVFAGQIANQRQWCRADHALRK